MQLTKFKMEGGEHMANTQEYCKGCLYNIFKTKGGYGKICNGLTIKKYNRCPEWRINEVRKDGHEGIKVALRKV